MKNVKVVIISGYFNPTHSGHINLIKSAQKLGDELWVIVNNDDQVKLKGSCPFQNENERQAIVGSIQGVNTAMIAADNDRSICWSLRNMVQLLKKTEAKGRLKFHVIFANGGDQTSANPAEKAVCDELGIEMVFGVGNDGKSQSSSELIHKAYLWERAKYSKGYTS